MTSSYGGGAGGYGGPGGYDPGPTMAGGLDAAAQYGGQMGQAMGFNQQDGLGNKFMKGPQGIQMLAFGGGIAGATVGFFNLFNLANEGFIEWIICFYQIAFGLIMVMLEIQGEWVDKYPKAKEYQALLVEYCRFLTILGGRGAFYFFVGSLSISNGCTGTDYQWTEILVGLYVFFIGGVCIAMQFNPSAAQGTSGYGPGGGGGAGAYGGAGGYGGAAGGYGGPSGPGGYGY